MNPEQLPHLETFARAAELSSFTAAAQGLGLTQAAVSQRIRALELAVATPLFRRRAGRVELTEAGQRLHPYAQRILAMHAEARQEVTGKKAPVVGELELAASSVPGEHLLPALLATFHQKYPHIQVRATVVDSQAVLSQVEHGKLQLGMVGGKSDSPHLVFRRFGCDRLVIVVPPEHSWHRRKRVTLDQLCKQPLVLREAGSGSRWCLERALASAGKSAKDLNVVLELGSNEAIKESVRRGVGLAVLSDEVVKKDRKPRRLHALDVIGLSLERDIFLVWDRRRALSIPAHLFLDFVAPCPHAERQA
ncbi:MAG: LysR family transcriptional regulator [Gemmataceae bacterium]|nr:LysR family transcriptional regulator [Gemmataceae bacterium]